MLSLQIFFPLLNYGEPLASSTKLQVAVPTRVWWRGFFLFPTICLIKGFILLCPWFILRPWFYNTIPLFRVKMKLLMSFNFQFHNNPGKLSFLELYPQNRTQDLQTPWLIPQDLSNYIGKIRSIFERYIIKVVETVFLQQTEMCCQNRVLILEFSKSFMLDMYLVKIKLL